MKTRHAKPIRPTKCLSDLKRLLASYRQFLKAFELLFDHEWDLTKDRINDPSYIAGTFIAPHVADEADNWANRAMLLDYYRELKTLLGE